MGRRAFTLLELLVVIAVVALLVAILLPALRSARSSGQAVRCLSQLRQVGVICRAYADENRGRSPALGQPYAAVPNWGLVVQEAAGVAGTGTELFTAKSVLVCPACATFYGREMTRTYAINVTGKAGAAMGDPDDYDDAARPAFVRMDLVSRPEATALVLDAAVASFPSNAPPPTRTASVIDFRQAAHVSDRIGRWHDNRKKFQAVMFDGSARPHEDVPVEWLRPLP